MKRRHLFTSLLGTIFGLRAAPAAAGTPAPARSYIKNCHIVPKTGDHFVGGTYTLFLMPHGSNEMLARLDGYAIIPREEYYRLLGLQTTLFAGPK